MKKAKIILLAFIWLVLGVSIAPAADISLFDWSINLDGAVYAPGDSLPANIDTSNFKFDTGLGNITVSMTGASSHYLALFLDHEIDKNINTYYNEYGLGTGTVATGQSWEIDEPGYLFGDIYNHFLNKSLDNTNAIPSGYPDDVSMALGWNFVLLAGQTAAITFNVSTEESNVNGFFLSQYDPDSQAGIYFSSRKAVPEPVTLLLFGIGLVGCVAAKKKIKAFNA